MRRTIQKSFFLILFLCFFAAIQAQKVSRQTYVYAVKDTDTLRLDKYATVTTTADTVSRPVVLFAFGGGFTGGERNDRRYVPFFMHLVRSGFTVVSIDYRTALKDVDPSKMSTIEGFATNLTKAVSIAVEDYITATAFVISQSKAWKINPSQIVACGSSAGAITVLQTEYTLCSGNDANTTLPADFNYVGVVSFAGGILAQGEPQWGRQPCPIMLFHGDADRRVPFDNVVVGTAGLYGSAYIANQLKEKSWPYWFVKVQGGGHETAVDPMKDNREDITIFLKEFVLGKKKDCAETDQVAPGHHGKTPKLTLEDYIKENLKP